MRSRELDKRYDMIRAANILNLDYFSDEFLAAALQSLGECLDAGGMLCVVRTRSDGSNHGSLFEKAENGFNAVQRIGDGSEIEHIVLSAS
jgi:phosphosulfolactate synthase (CoM biosynthesis protein A)